jgi:hypothetical protein
VECIHRSCPVLVVFVVGLGELGEHFPSVAVGHLFRVAKTDFCSLTPGLASLMTVKIINA